jgi:predicted alpha/beta hydrolase
VLPATAALFHMFPARALRLGEDVPEHAIREWSAWCRSPHYLAGPPGTARRAKFARLTMPLRAYSFSDDRYTPYRAAAALLTLYPNARAEHHHIVPRDIGIARIGHFGFFYDGPMRSLWSATADWLTATAR